jgi:hypothetical protein
MTRTSKPVAMVLPSSSHITRPLKLASATESWQQRLGRSLANWHHHGLRPKPPTTKK